MYAKWLGMTLVAASLLTGCGTGNATFDVDVYSWLNGTTNDTLAYGPLPGPGTVTINNTPQKLSLLPGVGSSFVDTVRVTGMVDLRNQTGSGSVALQIYLAADSAGTSSPSAAVFSPAPSATVNGSNTSVLLLSIPNLSAQLDSLFTKSEVWVKLAATVTNSGIAPLQGKAVLTGLQLHVVVNDKIF
jgi:hypothetical protein